MKFWNLDSELVLAAGMLVALGGVGLATQRAAHAAGAKPEDSASVRAALAESRSALDASVAGVPYIPATTTAGDLRRHLLRRAALHGEWRAKLDQLEGELEKSRESFEAEQQRLDRELRKLVGSDPSVLEHAIARTGL
jgi:hypothetical protein